MATYNLDKPEDWKPDPANRQGHLLHVASGDVVSVGEDAVKKMTASRTKADAEAAKAKADADAKAKADAEAAKNSTSNP